MIDVIILLGGGTDGTLTPILYTKERLFAFIKIYKKYWGVPIIVSGGYSTWMKFIPTHREADVMKHFLVAHGILERSIFVERKSRLLRNFTLHERSTMMYNNARSHYYHRIKFK